MSISLCITSYDQDYSLVYNLLEELQKQETPPSEIIFYCSGIQSSEVIIDIPNILHINEHQVAIFSIFIPKRTNQAIARNICSKIASSEYVMFFDVDDIPHPMKIRITEDIIKRTNIDFIVHNYHQTNRSSNIFDDIPISFDTYPVTEIDKNSTNIICEDYPIHHSHISVKREIFKKIQFKESNEYNRREDGKFCQELIIGGYSGLYCPIKLINYIK